MSDITTLIPVLKKDREGNDIVVTGDHKCILLDDFKQKFGDDYRFDSIINHENCTPMWKRVFEEWKHRGILK